MIELILRVFESLLRAILDLFRGLVSAPKAKEGLPYQANASLLTPAERSFFGVLEKAVDGQFRVMIKVRLADVIKVRPGLSASKRQSAFNRIQSKHVDFALCRPSDLRIAGVIELDDSSHSRANRRKRDEFMEEAMDSAGLSFYRFSAKRSYSTEQIRTTIQSLIYGENENTPTSKGVCPNCGGELVLRTANKGKHQGEQFWGCSNYPKCRTILPLEDQKSRGSIVEET